MIHRTFDEQIANFNRMVSSWDINQEYKIALLGMIASLGYEHEKSITPEPHWIPVTERLPEEYGEYLVTVRAIGWDCEEYDANDIAYFDNDGFHKANKVTAWCELPEPYKGVTDGDD